MSQFKKRMAKAKAQEKEADVIRKELIEGEVTLTEAVEKIAEIKMAHTAIDIFTDPATKKHMAAIISYDPVTMECKIREIKPVQRGISLQFEINKKALRTLVREKK